MIEIRTANDIKKIRKAYRDLTEKELREATVSALNHTIRKGKTAVSKEIRSVYKMKAKDIKKTLTLSFAHKKRLEARVNARGSALPVSAYSHRQTKKGVSVNIKGRRKIINKAFIQTMRSGHKSVFARGEYQRGGKFGFRNKRIRKRGNDLPITQLMSLSVPSAMSNNVIVKHLSEKMANDFPNRLAHEAERKRLKYKGYFS